ncbi:hypothetical protein [Zhenhengia sp.]|uniref:hypothetical protein n=1 Tax=Zhenhengia sp. TaxID=2944208 RepID=UPI003991FDB4
MVNEVNESNKEEQKITNKVDDEKLEELNSSKDNLNTESDLYRIQEIQIREEIESYIRKNLIALI